MPLYNWDECAKGFTRYVNRDQEPRESDEEVYERLQNEYLERFGMAEHTEEFLKIKLFLIKLRLAYIETGDLSLLDQIAIEEINLRNADPSKLEGLTTDQALVHLSKWLGGGLLNAREITVTQFKTLTLEYERAHKKK